MIEFDGTHGLSAYNKTDQEKYGGSDSTFISPKYVQTIESKPVSEWIIAVGIMSIFRNTQLCRTGPMRTSMNPDGGSVSISAVCRRDCTTLILRHRLPCHRR